jgi:hypothetical protein
VAWVARVLVVTHVAGVVFDVSWVQNDGNAPHEMVALAAAELVCLVVALAVTFGLKFKISMHAIVAAGATGRLGRGCADPLPASPACRAD